jgi:hypothetical protein
MKVAGILIMILGFGLSVFTAFSSFTQEKILKVGSNELTRSQPDYLSWAPFIGLAVMVVGGYLILQAGKK